MDNREKATRALEIALDAGRLGLDYFRRRDALLVEVKGHQDFVSEADKQLELLVRRRLSEVYPEDAIVGEEHDSTPGTSGFTWVIDPIDGTTNFVNGIPDWTVVIAGVADAQIQIGVIVDPCHDEQYVAVRGQGATLNNRPLALKGGRGLRDGSVGVGFSNRVSTAGVNALIGALLAGGSVFYRNASGALSLAYVAAGRLLGYSEEHMNAWDCLAGQLLVAEAGGGVEVQDADRMIAEGGRVIVGAPDVFPELLAMSEKAFGKRSN